MRRPPNIAVVASALFRLASLAEPLLAQATGSAPTTKPDSAVTLGTVKITAATADETHVTVLERLTLPVTVSITRQAHRGDGQPHRHRRRREVPAERVPPEAQQRRHAGDDGHARVGRELERAQPDLRRRRAAHRAHRQQQHDRRSALGARRARRDRAHRHDVRPLLRRVRRQLDGRRHGDHDAPARRSSRARSSRRRRSRASISTARSARTARRRRARRRRPLRQASRFWASGNYQNSHSQPLSYVTSATFPTGTTGGFAEQNKLGAPANVLGATGLLHTRHDERAR